jgi:cytosine/adenosine deaminase-related metal-dependent hydrolase
MCEQRDRTTPATVELSGHGRGAAGGPSRRRFLKSSAALATGAAAAQVLSRDAFAQAAGAVDAELARVQGERRILLKGGVVLTLDRQVGDFAQADVLVEGGKIREVRPNIEVSRDAVAVIDAANRVVIPGFVDTHSHSYQGLLRNILVNGLLNPDYNRDIQNILTPAYQATDAYAGMLVTALGFIDMGTTAIVDISQVSHTPEHSDACIRALQESGIRAVFAYHRGAGPAAQYPQDIKRLQRTYFSSKDQLLTLALTANLNANVFALAREVGVPIVVHVRNVLPQRNDGEKLLQLSRAGLLRPGDEYIHCLHFPADTWRLIKDTGGHVSLSPPIEMTMGHGTPAIQEALDNGVRPSLSSDHAVTLSSDFFTLMRTAAIAQRYFVLQRGRNGEQNLPPLLTCRDVLEFATVEGARCANLDGKVGTLSPGKDADIAVLRGDRLDVWPLNNAPGTVVNLMNPSHVETVLIAGKVRKWRGSLVGVDEQRVRQLMQESRDAVLRRAGFEMNLLG